jgi:hypothetical protein
MSRSAFWRIVSKAGARAGLPVKTYAHLLRHSCGYFLANKGCDLRLIQDYLGHKQLSYTALNPSRFAGCGSVASMIGEWPVRAIARRGRQVHPRNPRQRQY